MEQINHSIACNVNSCAHHAGNQAYCTLSSIHVGHCQGEVKSCDGTECDSFQAASGSCGCR